MSTIDGGYAYTHAPTNPAYVPCAFGPAWNSTVTFSDDGRTLRRAHDLLPATLQSESVSGAGNLNLNEVSRYHAMSTYADYAYEVYEKVFRQFSAALPGPEVSFFLRMRQRHQNCLIPLFLRSC